MTTAELLTYYADLLIIQYHDKPKARAHIKATVGPLLVDQLALAVQNGFNLDGTAEGVQLDILAKYAGVARASLDFNGPIELSDADLLILIKIKIMQNSSGSALSDIQDLISMFFPDSLRVFDYANMRMSYLFDSLTSGASEQLAEVIVRQGLLPKPMGVQLGALIFSPGIDTFFSFRTYDLPVVNGTGLNNYSSYNTASPWLTYADALIF